VQQYTTIDLREFRHFQHDDTYVVDVSFLNADILMVTNDTGIFFMSVESGECVSHCQLENSKFLLRAAVLSDGRVCFGGIGGYCAIFKLPQEAEEFISEHAERKYSSLFATVPFFSPSLKYITNGK